MKANVKTETALNTISNVLNEAEFLFGFDLVKLSNRTELNVLTDEKEVEFVCVNPSVMKDFLNKLKVLSPNHKDDIEELLLELAS
ncbi:hypothetical protein [Metabacillus fastidiosus]|uniref:hypothetical protein n=1 Tax=Metabacillus fastidiosus TaxID=1458 RepID=UPI002E23B46A|nr:hypothetical protein [Metabacillus fastidiosus]